MQDSIFTKIINSEIPAYKVYEDESTVAFLDIHPKQPGHVLVIPKKQVVQLWDLPDTDYQAVMRTCKKVADRLRAVLKTARVGVQVIGLDVDHAHVHLIPFNTTKEFYTQSDMDADPDFPSLALMAKRIAI